MTKCKATTLNGTKCKKNGKDEYNGLCTTHYTSSIPAEERDRIAAEREAIQTETKERERAQRRNEIIEHNQLRRINYANCSVDTVYHYARNLAKLWVRYKIPGNLLGQVYVALRKTSLAHDSWMNLIQGVIEFYYFVYNHPDGLTWENIPDADKNTALNNLQAVMRVFEPVDLTTIYSQGDVVRDEAVRRQNEEEEARRNAERERLIREEMERQAQLIRAERERRNREDQIVFRRDPEGSIDLAAFATDSQSVHRSSVQVGTDKVLTILMARTPPADLETLVEITAALSDNTILRFKTEAGKDRIIMELTNDYFNTMAFNRNYGEVLDRVWTVIRKHKEKKELVWRLAEEIADGIKQCVNGKMARLAQTLYSYDAEVTAALQNEAPREAFQAKIALVTKLPVEEREKAAIEIFNEYRIPNEERPVWLEPLLE